MIIFPVNTLYAGIAGKFAFGWATSQSDIYIECWFQFINSTAFWWCFCTMQFTLVSNSHVRGRFGKTLRWRHNGRDSVSNLQPHDCLLNRLFRRRSKKTSKLRVTGLCVENSPGTGEFPAQMASNAENVSIWWRHHEMSVCRENTVKQNKTKQKGKKHNSCDAAVLFYCRACIFFVIQGQFPLHISESVLMNILSTGKMLSVRY